MSLKDRLARLLRADVRRPKPASRRSKPTKIKTGNRTRPLANRWDPMGPANSIRFNEETYIDTFPSNRRVIHICEAIGEVTGREQTLLGSGASVAKLNPTMIGWANYFCLGPVRKAYRAVASHARKRLLPWLCAKQKLGKKESATDRSNFTITRETLPRYRLPIRGTSLGVLQ
jgi:hypothetical protein